MYYNLFIAFIKWIKSIKIWRIILNEITITNVTLPVFYNGDVYCAAEPFYHADRTVDFDILIYVLEGVIYVTEGETDYSVGEGELLFLKHGVHHYGKYEIPKGTRWYFIHFGTDDDIKGFSEYGTPDKEKLYVNIPKYTKGLSGSDTEWQIADFIAYANSTDKMRSWNVNIRLSQLLSEMAFSCSSTALTLPIKICRYLDSHYREDFSVKKLEKEFYLSYKYMAACFKKEIGCSMQQYHTIIRLTEAARLLRSTLLPINEIARRVGYEDSLYFSKRFSGRYKTSPSAFRKTARHY